MKILMIIHHLKSGGPAKQAQLMEKYLKSAGNEVELYTISKKTGFLHSLRDLTKSYRELKKKIKYTNYDIIQVFDAFYAGFIGIKLKLKFNIPVILRVGTVIEDFYMGRIIEKLRYPYNKISFNIIKLPLFILTRTILLFFDHIVFNSYYLMKKYSHELNKKRSVIWNGIDLDIFSPIVRKMNYREQVKMLYVGRIEPRKGILDLVTVSLELKQKKINHQIEVIGHTNKKRYLCKIKKAIESNNLQNQFILTSPLSHQELAEKYAQNIILLFPTNSKEFPITESLPNVIIEAMAMGLIVIATNIAGVPELIDDKKNGFLVDENKIVELASIISDIKENHYNLEVMSKNNIDKVKKLFSIEKCIDTYLKLYRKIRS